MRKKENRKEEKENLTASATPCSTFKTLPENGVGTRFPKLGLLGSLQDFTYRV